MSKGKKTNKEITAWMGVLVSILVFVYAIIYNTQTAKKEKMERMQSICKEVENIAGTLSSEYTKGEVFKEKRAQLESIYFGPFNSIKDTAISKSLIELREAIRDYNVNNKTPDALNRIKTRSREFTLTYNKVFGND